MKRGLFLITAAAVAAASVWYFSGGRDTRPRGPSVAERAKESAPRGNALSDRIISSEDLPPEGTRSMFDHLLAQNDGLPYPFEKLVALIEARHPEGKPPVSLMIPSGRSLLKAQADFQHPRVLVAADFQTPGSGRVFGFAPRGQLFLGFVENAGEIEVISYNEAAGRYEFQLVQNYCENCVPRIVYARRAICTTCHQGGTPIFPQRPWNETNAQPEIAGKIREARGGGAPYLGLPVSNPLSAPERFDELTDTGAYRVAAQRAWLDGCSEAGGECRRAMLTAALRFALNPGGFNPAGPEAVKLLERQTAAWPAGGIGIPESDIRNRDPLAETRGIKGYLRALFTPQSNESNEPGATDNEDLEAFDRLPKLPAELDPVTPRPPRRVLTVQDLDGAYGLAQFFTDADLKLVDKAAGYEYPRLEAAVQTIPAEFFAPAPFARIKTLNALLAALGQSEREYCCLDTAEMSPPAASGEPPLALAADSPLIPFEKYCFACHRGNPAKRLNFMGGATEGEVLAGIKGTAGIRDVLDWQRYRGTDKESTLMPPGDSHQRRDLEKALAQDPQVLEEMRKLVPGMFDF